MNTIRKTNKKMNIKPTGKKYKILHLDEVRLHAIEVESNNVEIIEFRGKKYRLIPYDEISYGIVKIN